MLRAARTDVSLVSGSTDLNCAVPMPCPDVELTDVSPQICSPL